MPHVRRPFAAVLLAGVVLAGHALSAHAQDYPRLGLYGSMYGDGYPLWNSSGVLDPTVLDQIARFHEVILDASPITPYRPDAALALRIRRPDIRLLAYISGERIWPADAPDSTVHFPTRYRHMVRRMDGFLYNQFGEEFGTRHTAWANVNLAKHDAFGRYVMAESLAALFKDAIIDSRIWDGVFVDLFCETILWMEVPAESIDIVRAGYSSRTSFAAGWKAGTDTLAARLRRDAGPYQILVGNCAQGTKYAWFNGWMSEDFPHQNGGTWYANMYNDPGGYLINDARWTSPTSNYLFSAYDSTTGTPYSAESARRVRFGLGSASLAGGYGAFGVPSKNSRPTQYMAWWYDEYAVDPSTGASSPDIRFTGWLGQPLGSVYQWISPISAPDAVGNPTFETSVTSGWSFFTSIGASLARDTSSAMEGSASAHFTLSTATPTISWSTNYASTGTLLLVNGLQYSATFWARVDAPRKILVGAGLAGGWGGFQWVQLETGWHHYQISFNSAATGNAQMIFHLASESGDVWLDDVHLQRGSSNVFRRDFQNGTVLVNPSDDFQNVVLERSFGRIAGSVDPGINDGVWSASQTVRAHDALFLIGTDQVAPAAVRDLHPVPPGTANTRGARSPIPPR